MPARICRALFLILALTLILLPIPVAPASAAPPAPRFSDNPPRVPATAAAQPSATAAPSPLALPPLKAVLLVGPIDGDYGEGTTNAKAAMERAAKVLEAHGVSVRRFYAPDSDWEQIKAAAQSAQFLYYAGHGVYWSDMPYPNVGGFYLSSRFVSPDELRAELKLAPGAIVMLKGACFSAGSSGNDTISVTSAEAQRRVAQYSDPFLDTGAGGYYADWFDNALESITGYLFEGKTLGAAYEAFFDFNGATVERYRHPNHLDQVMWLDKDYWYEPKPQYNYAFAGRPDATLASLFQQTTMQITPRELVLLVAPGAPARNIAISVRATGPDAFTWSATSDAAWMTLSKATGASGESALLTIRPPVALGLHRGAVRITATSASISDREQTVTVQVRVVKTVWSVYGPSMWRQAGR